MWAPQGLQFHVPTCTRMVQGKYNSLGDERGRNWTIKIKGGNKLLEKVAWFLRGPPPSLDS